MVGYGIILLKQAVAMIEGSNMMADKKQALEQLADEAYGTYVSLYLSCCDNNSHHFYERDKDIEPILNIHPDNKEAVAKAYLKAAADIAKDALKMGGFASVDDIVKEYPVFEDYKDFLIERKYHPTTKEELQALCDDESIYLGDIDTSKITDMSNLFYFSNRKDFSGIETWDVSNVVNMSGMFNHAEFFNHPIGDWDVSHVKYMDEMFYYAVSFNQDISKWDISNVESMKDILIVAPSFAQILPKEWQEKTVYKNPKYEITNEMKEYKFKNYSYELYRIRALKDFKTVDGNMVHKGDLGGWVNGDKFFKYSNLSQEGNCWIGKDAIVCFGDIKNNALVTDNAVVIWSKVLQNAQVSGNAKIFDRAVISNNAKVYDNAQVSGDGMRVAGNAQIYENAFVFNGSGQFYSTEVFGNAKVHGNALVHDAARIYGNAEVRDNAEVKWASQISDDVIVKGNECVYCNVDSGNAFNNIKEHIMNVLSGKEKIDGLPPMGKGESWHLDFRTILDFSTDWKVYRPVSYRKYKVRMNEDSSYKRAVVGEVLKSLYQEGKISLDSNLISLYDGESPIKNYQFMYKDKKEDKLQSFNVEYNKVFPERVPEFGIDECGDDNHFIKYKDDFGWHRRYLPNTIFTEGVNSLRDFANCEVYTFRNVDDGKPFLRLIHECHNMVDDDGIEVTALYKDSYRTMVDGFRPFVKEHMDEIASCQKNPFGKEAVALQEKFEEYANSIGIHSEWNKKNNVKELDNVTKSSVKEVSDKNNQALQEAVKETFLTKAQWELVKVGEKFVRDNNVRRKDGKLMLFNNNVRDKRKGLSSWMKILEQRGFVKNSGKDKDVCEK